MKLRRRQAVTALPQKCSQQKVGTGFCPKTGEARAYIRLLCSPHPRRSKVRFNSKRPARVGISRPLPCSSSQNRTRCAGLQFWQWQNAKKRRMQGCSLLRPLHPYILDRASASTSAHPASRKSRRDSFSRSSASVGIRRVPMPASALPPQALVG